MQCLPSDRNARRARIIFHELCVFFFCTQPLFFRLQKTFTKLTAWVSTIWRPLLSTGLPQVYTIASVNSFLVSVLVSFLSVWSTFMHQNIKKVGRKSNKTCKLLSLTKKSLRNAILQHNATQFSLSASSLWRATQLDDDVLKMLNRITITPTPQGCLARLEGS